MISTLCDAKIGKKNTHHSIVKLLSKYVFFYTTMWKEALPTSKHAITVSRNHGQRPRADYPEGMILKGFARGDTAE